MAFQLPTMPWQKPRSSESRSLAHTGNGQVSGQEPDLVALVTQRYTYARNAKYSMLPTWATCLAFLVGEQWREWDKPTRKLVVPAEIPPWRIQAVTNELPGIVDTAASKLSRSRQIPIALPNTDDEDDKAGAAVATDGLAHWWHVDGMELTELQMNVHRLTFGCAFYHVYWDAAKEAKISSSGPTGQRQVRRAPVGDVCCEVLSPFDVFPQPCEEYEHCSWVIIARRKPLSWFRETFPKNGAEVKSDSGDVEDVFSSLVPGSTQPGFGASQGADSGAPDGEGLATLKVLYEKPSKPYPRGRTVYVAGKVLLFRADRLPLPKPELPVVMVRYRYVPKRMWPMGLLEFCLSPQRELNRGQSNEGEILRWHGRPKWLVAQESKVDPRAITSAPGEIVEYYASGGAPPPQMLVPGNLPAFISEYADRARQSLQGISGQHEVTDAQVPTGVTAASAINLLQQADNTRLNGPATYGKIALEKAATLVSATQAERYREERVAQLVGMQHGAQVKCFRGADIGDRDVLVELTQGMDDNYLSREQAIANLSAEGFFAFPAPLQIELATATGKQWLVEAIQKAQSGIQQMQAQQMQQQAAMQPQPPPPPDPVQQALLQAGQQQDQHQQQLAQQDQAHQQQLQQMLLQHHLEQAAQPPPDPGQDPAVQALFQHGQAEDEHARALQLAQLQHAHSLAALKARPKPTVGAGAGKK